MADEIALPAAAMDGTGSVVAIWRPQSPSEGTLHLAWTDSLGRLVEQHQADVGLLDLEVAVPLDLRRAVLPCNRVVAQFQPRDGGEKRQAEASFVARTAPEWTDYQVLMWQDEPPAALAALHGLGVTGTAVIGPLTAAGQVATQQRLAESLRWYTENLATDFYAAYHRWTPDRPVNWRFEAARQRHRAVPDGSEGFDRSPSLSDPAWLGTVTARLQDIAWQQSSYRPLFHNLGDESGIGDLAAAWDFDLSSSSLDAMRLWLQGRYGSLQALNQAWGTQFTTWSEVRPALTDQALRSDASVPAWMDFKAWMDTAFARAVRAGTDAIHRGDPTALSALEGAQVPGWGGYDYGLLAGAVDVMEIYDAGNAVEIARSINPALRILTTTSGSGPAEKWRLWHEWLLGGRGVILWDEARSFMGEDGHAGPGGLDLAPLLHELGGALGAQWLDAAPEAGHTAILYSQGSFRMQWLLDRRAAGTSWTDRDAEAESTDDNAWRIANRRAAQALAGLGAQPRWVTPDTLVKGRLAQDGTRILVLPHSLALSDAEVLAIRDFAANGGLVLADVPPGARDGLGRARQASPLADLAASGGLRYPRALLEDDEGLSELDRLLALAGAAAPLQLLGSNGEPARGLAIHLVRSGGVLLVGIERVASGGEDGDVTLRLPHQLWIQSLHGEPLRAQADRLVLHVDPVHPALLALSIVPLPAVTLDGPQQTTPGALVEFHLGLSGRSQGAGHAVRVTVTDPLGHEVPSLAETVRVGSGGTTWRLRLALSDAQGVWRLQADDALGGGEITHAILVIR